MNKTTNLVVIMATVLLATSCQPKSEDSKDAAENSNNAKFDSRLERDTEFVVEAADDGLLKVQLGLLAQHNSLTAEIKQLGQMIVDDHNKANEELRNIAFKKNISIPTRMSDKNQKKYDDLADKTGDAFDKAYTELMVKNHKDDIDRYKKEFDKGEDDDLRTWASNKVPTLEYHLQMAEQAEKNVRNKGNRSSN